MLKPVAQICFFGSDPIALPLLDYLEQEPRVNLRAVFTQPDRRAGRGKKWLANAIKQWAVSRQIEVQQPEKPLPETADWLQAEGIDLALVMAYGQLLTPALLEAPREGMWNMHGSLLPELRGASPLETALAEGKAKTGMTLMRMVKKMDAGPVADQTTIPIHEHDLASDLRERAGLATPALLQRNLQALLEGQCSTHPQENTKVTYCRRLSKADGFLDLSQPADLLERRHRACQPWPGTFFEYEDQRLKVGSLKISPGKAPVLNAGVLHQDDERLYLGTGTLPLEILTLQRPGGKMVETAAFLRGFSLQSGTHLRYPPSQPWVAKQPF